MTLREFYLERRKAELPVFLKVLKALPKNRLDYKPDDRSPSARDLAWVLTSGLKACVDVVKEGKAEWGGTRSPSFDELLERYESLANELAESVSQLDDEEWDKPAQFYYNGKVVSEQPTGQFLWFILFDHIHHRGQLTAYLRPMGGSVPAIYGPSADEKSVATG